MAKNARGSIAKGVASLEKMVESGNLGFEFQDEAKTRRDVVLSKIYSGFDQLPYIVKMVIGRGVFEKIRDSYAGSESHADAIDSADDTIDYLYLGKWFKAKVAGVRLGDLYEAAKRALTKAGMEVPAEADFREKYSDETLRDNLKAMPEIKAELAIIAKEKADAKAAELIKAAEGVTSNLGTI